MVRRPGFKYLGVSLREFSRNADRMEPGSDEDDDWIEYTAEEKRNKRAEKARQKAHMEHMQKVADGSEDPNRLSSDQLQ